MSQEVGHYKTHHTLPGLHTVTVNPMVEAIPPGTTLKVDMWLQRLCEAYGDKIHKPHIIEFITKKLNEKFSLDYTEARLAQRLEVLLGISGGDGGVEIKKEVEEGEEDWEVDCGGEVSEQEGVNGVPKQKDGSGVEELGALALYTPEAPAHGFGETELQENTKVKKENTMEDEVEDSNMIGMADDNIEHDTENQTTPQPDAEDDNDPFPIPLIKRTATSTPPTTKKKPRILRSEKKQDLGTPSYPIGMEGFSRIRALELDQSTTASQRRQFSVAESQWFAEHYPTMRRKGGETNWQKLADCFELQFGLQRRKEVLRVATRVEIDEAYVKLREEEEGGGGV